MRFMYKISAARQIAAPQTLSLLSVQIGITYVKAVCR